MKSEIREMQTSNGLHKFIINYFDDDFHLVDESIATWWRIHEVDENGRFVGSSMGFITEI